MTDKPPFKMMIEVIPPSLDNPDLERYVMHDINRTFGQLGSRDTVLYKPAFQKLRPSAQPMWDECTAFSAPNPEKEAGERIHELIDRARNELREREADIVLTALAKAGGDPRDLHQQIHPDRTVYLLDGKPLVEVFRPRPQHRHEWSLTPKAFPFSEEPAELLVDYRFLWESPVNG
jgi:hypothetical protein